MLKDKITIAYNLDEVADSLDDGIKFLKEHNIDHAEIRTIDGKNIANLTLDETRELKETMDSSGLTVSAIASPLFKWHSKDAVNENKADLFGMTPFLSREEKEAMIRKVIDQACILGTNKIRIFSGLKSGKERMELPEEESELLKYALRVAKEKSVFIMLENEPVCYISKLEDYINMFTSGEYNGLRAWFDIANVYEEGEIISEADIKKLAPYIDYFHVKDPKALMEHSYVSLGKGYINYKRIFDILEKEIENHFCLSIETHVKNDKWNASHESLDYLYRLLTTRRIRYALVGIGRVSQKHFNAMKENDNCTLIGIYDIDVEKRKNAALAHDCINYNSYEELINNGQVDVISICTPHDTHIDLAEKALKNGKKVLCEKPLALNSGELNRYISRNGTDDSTYVVFQNKFNLAVKIFYEFEAKKLGDPQYVSMTLRWWRDADYYKDWHGSREISGGALITQAIHSLELITHISKGAAIKSIKSTQVKTRDEITLPDIIVAIVEFENGIVCNIEICLSTRYHNLESSLFVVGTKACIKIAGVALSELVHPEVGQIESETGDGHYYGNGHVALYKTHANHYLENSDPNDIFLTKPSDLVKTLELIEIIEKSLETNRPGNK